jgi:hypothetical protein
MRSSGVRGSSSTARTITAAITSRSAAIIGRMMRWSDLDVCTACGKRGADVRPDFRAKPIGGIDIAKGQRAERRPRALALM